MSDELDKLKAALKAGEPAPDPATKAAALARAMAEFDRVQGSATAARPKSDPPPRAGFWTGATAMMKKLTTRAALAGTASLAVIALAVVTLGPDLSPPPATVTAPPAAPTDDAASAPAAQQEARDEAVAQPAPQAEPPAAAQEADALAKASEREMTPAAPPAAAGGIAAPSRSLHEVAPAPQPDTEAYANATPNPLKVTAEEPVSTFSIDVDTASYAVIRSSLNAGQLPPPDAVRIEEMVNYFPYDWPAPGDNERPFHSTVSVMETPWNPGTRLVTIALQGRRPAIADRPALNLVFLIDTSGSMQDADKLPLLQQSLRLMLPALREGDEVAIVTYAGSAGEVLPPTPATDRDAILSALTRLEAGGSTAGQAGLEQAYATARRMAAEGEVTRVLLATDGDFNVGLSDPAALEDFIARERAGGTYLSVLGFGRGNLDDATMQALAQNGNGSAAYIDTLSEARKVLVDELSGALFPIADDVKVQVEWNPATVAEYRLIGYETRALAREDFNNDRVDAGEIGAGHSVTAIYEITPTGSPAVRTSPLRYGETAPPPVANADEFGFLRLRYKEPGEDASRLIETPIRADTAQGGPDADFAAAIAGFGQLLTGGAHLGDWGWDEAIALAAASKGEDPFGYRAEAITLMRLAQGLSR